MRSEHERDRSMRRHGSALRPASSRGTFDQADLGLAVPYVGV